MEGIVSNGWNELFKNGNNNNTYGQICEKIIIACAKETILWKNPVSTTEFALNKHEEVFPFTSYRNILFGHPIWACIVCVYPTIQ